MLTNIHEAKFCETKWTETNQPIIKPVAVIDYNKKMGGVDLSDQIVQYYDVLHSYNLVCVDICCYVVICLIFMMNL